VHKPSGSSPASNVYLEWIPGHEGFTGNKKANLLARKGALTNFREPEPAVGVSASIAKALFKHRAKEAHSLRWRNSGATNVAHLLIKVPNKTFTNSILNLKRTDAS